MSSFTLSSQYDDGFFSIGDKYGFLPTYDPLDCLPDTFNKVQDILNRLHVQGDASTQILQTEGRIVTEVENLPNLVDAVREVEDVKILQALYRGYAFITSAYTLEPAYREHLATGKYGTARQKLPKNVAQPFVAVSEKLDVFPWLDYHYSYSLGNYKKIDPQKDLHWQNLDMCVKFAGTSDEIGFIMLHVYINELSPNLLKSIHLCFDSMVGNGDATNMVDGLKLNYETIRDMNKRRQEMWKASNPKNYNDFRVFIMGIKGNEELFGDGLVYEGCFNDEPQNFRGQTGAQDDIIPTEDIFTGLAARYPENKLTEYLIDLRKYRPKCVQSFFTDLRGVFGEGHMLKHLKESNNKEGLVWLWRIVDEIYRFRNGHWQFVQQYIMATTRYPKATGGTPITSWLVNQIEACLQYQTDILESLESIGPFAPADARVGDATEVFAAFNDLTDTLDQKKALLVRQVKHLNEQPNYNVELLYAWNQEHDLADDPALRSA
jgi:indoleamine 2,3-dioxygenase